MLWSTYVELAAQRGAGMSGPQPISLLDVNAWCTRMGVELVPWEAETLLLMDRAVLHVMAESERARRAQGK